MVTFAPTQSTVVMFVLVVLSQLATLTLAQTGTCGAPFELGTITTSVRNALLGDTTGGFNLMFNAPCASATGREIVVRFTIPSQTSVFASFRLTGTFDTVLVLAMNGCSYANAVGCSDDAAGGPGSATGGSALSGSLLPGTYYLVIDGYGFASFGEFALAYEFQITSGGAPTATPRPPPPVVTSSPPVVITTTTRSPPATPRPTPAPFEPPSPPSDRSSSGESPPSSADAPSTASAGGTKSKNKRVGVVVGASIGGVALFVAIAALLCCCCHPRRTHANQPTDNDDGATLPKPAQPAEPFGAPSDVSTTPFGYPAVTTKTTAPQPTPPFGGYWFGESPPSYSHATPQLPLPLGEVEAASISVMGGASTTPAYPFLPPTEVSITTPTATTTTTTTAASNGHGDSIPGFNRPTYPARPPREQQGCV